MIFWWSINMMFLTQMGSCSMKTFDIISISWCWTVPFFIQASIRDSARLCHFTLTGRSLRESSSRLSLPSRKPLCHLKISLLLTLLFILAAVILPYVCVGVIPNLTQTFMVARVSTLTRDNINWQNFWWMLLTQWRCTISRTEMKSNVLSIRFDLTSV